MTERSNRKESGKLVLVDDNPENLRTLKSLLDSEGYACYPAISGQLALDAVYDVEPDLILLDIMMPDMNGYEVCRQLKADKATRDIPVLFISALDDSLDKLKAFEVGGLDYIPKPFQAEEVLARVKTHISLAKTRQKLADANKKLIKHAFELEMKNKDLNAFSYTVSHDLRAPLRRIDGYSQMLEEDAAESLSQQAREYLERIRFNVKQMGQLIDDMLQLSRVSRTRIAPQNVSLSELAEKINKNLQSSYPAQQPTISIKPGMVAYCDPSLMEIALTNLFDNAWKYSARNDKARIEFGECERQGEKVFYLRDNGIGFDMKYVNKLFQPFQRLHNDSDFEGTGIGLATVAKVIQLHGGEIQVESQPGLGTEFFIKLPLGKH